MSDSLVVDDKRRLRGEMIAKRQGYSGNAFTASRTMADLFIHNIPLEKGAVISTYSPIRNEMDPHYLAETLSACGHPIVLPVVVGQSLPLVFRQHRHGDMLAANSLGIPEPTADSPALDPDILLVPLLAFDSQRNRLGYGGGFYDRTIAALRLRKPILAVGVAYADQQLPEIPVGTHDVRLDMIVTEINIL